MRVAIERSASFFFKYPISESSSSTGLRRVGHEPLLRCIKKDRMTFVRVVKLDADVEPDQLSGEQLSKVLAFTAQPDG